MPPPACIFRRLRQSKSGQDLFENPAEAKNCREMWGRKLHYFAEEVSIIGVRHAFDVSTSAPRKCIWMTLLLFGFGLAAYQIQDRISVYLSYPTAVGIEIVQATNLRFPQITFCNENMIRRSVATDFGFAAVTEQLFVQMLIPSAHEEPSNHSAFPAVSRSADQWSQIWTLLSEPLNDTVLSIQWSMGNLPISTIKQINTNMGSSCYAFNTEQCGITKNTITSVTKEDGEDQQYGYHNYVDEEKITPDLNFTTVQAGSQYGLNLLLFVNQAEYLAAVSPAAGFSMLIHDPEDTPLMYELGFLVGPGTFTSVSFSQETSLQLPSPYSNCSNTPGYRHSGCILDCQSNFVIDRCNCKMLHMTGQVRICNLPELIECVYPSYYAFMTATNGSGACSCQLECSQLSYRYTISQAPLSDLYVNNIVRAFNVSTSAQVRDLVVVKLFYSTLTYDEISLDASYTVFALLSDIGGALGLLLGATLLTVYEVMEFGYQFVRDGMRARQRKCQNERMNKNVICVAPALQHENEKKTPL